MGYQSFNHYYKLRESDFLPKCKLKDEEWAMLEKKFFPNCSAQNTGGGRLQQDKNMGSLCDLSNQDSKLSEISKTIKKMKRTKTANSLLEQFLSLSFGPIILCCVGAALCIVKDVSQHLWLLPTRC